VVLFWGEGGEVGLYPEVETEGDEGLEETNREQSRVGRSKTDAGRWVLVAGVCCASSSKSRDTVGRHESNCIHQFVLSAV
jgi:hypothetical protein